jgi:predicted transcriptional regulator
MSILAKINQRESLEKIEEIKPILYAQVLSVVGDEPLTAREIAQRIGRTTRQDIQPRITELLKRGMLEEKGKKYDKITDRNVTAYVLGGESI